jgi:hypothetical protein
MSAKSNQDLLSPTFLFRAVESFTLAEPASTYALSDLDNHAPVLQQLPHATVVQFFLKALEKFLLENADDDELDSGNVDFPKFC